MKKRVVKLLLESPLVGEIHHPQMSSEIKERVKEIKANDDRQRILRAVQLSSWEGVSFCNRISSTCTMFDKDQYSKHVKASGRLLSECSIIGDLDGRQLKLKRASSLCMFFISYLNCKRRMDSGHGG